MTPRRTALAGRLVHDLVADGEGSRDLAALPKESSRHVPESQVAGVVSTSRDSSARVFVRRAAIVVFFIFVFDAIMRGASVFSTTFGTLIFSAPARACWPEAEGQAIKYSSVPGFFLQDDPATNPSGFDFVSCLVFDLQFRRLSSTDDEGRQPSISG